MPVPEAAPDAVPPALAAGAVLIDVREPVEWAAGRAPDARHVPMSSLTDGHPDVPRDRPLFVICRSGSRSAAVAHALTAWGYDATNVTGGMQRWVALGLPVVADGGLEPAVV